jgi:hypothetical protein
MATYTLSGEQANTDFKLQLDGHGGAKPDSYSRCPVVGVQHYDHHTMSEPFAKRCDP